MVDPSCSTQICGRHQVRNFWIFRKVDILTFILSSLSLLVPLPPDFPPLLDKIKKLLAPSQKVLNIFYESLTSGEQKQFAERVWEKAKTDEPFILARRTCSHVYDQWKKRSVAEEDDGKKGSP